MQKGAVAGLRALGETAAIPALESFKRRVSDQEGADVDRAIDALRAAAKPPAKAKDEALDELRTTVRKLGEDLDKLRAEFEAGREDSS